jgi:hypothetical protein
MKNKSDVKRLIRESIREILSKKKRLLMEYTYENEDYELELNFQGVDFFIKGFYKVEVSSGAGGFEHDIPFGNGTGHQNTTEYEIEDSTEEFTIDEVFTYDASEHPTVPVTDPKLKELLQAYINKKVDFSREQEKAIERAQESGD